MEIILKKDVAKLGNADEIVKVKAGYGMNYLIPQGYAILATPSAKKVLAETIKQRAFKEEKLRSQAQALATKIESLKVTESVKVSSNGKLFGSITSAQLSSSLSKLGVDVDKKDIEILKDVKELGTYEAKIKCYKNIFANLKFEVVAE